jgi:hypothetical protein
MDVEEKKAGLACTHFGYLDTFPLCCDHIGWDWIRTYFTSNAHELTLTYSEQWLVCGSVALSLGAQGILTSHLYIITCMLALLRIIAPVENGQHIE